MTISSVKGFDAIYAQAIRACNGEAALRDRFAAVSNARTLLAHSDAWYLSHMSRRIFRAGLKHAMVDAKWPAFEQVFEGFDPETVAYLSDDALDGLMTDTRIIRHWGKLTAVRWNASAMLELICESKSFGRYLVAWPAERTIDLWLDLRQRFKQLGGKSAPYFLRMVGKDTFLINADVKRGLKRAGVEFGNGNSKSDLRCIQSAFNQWQGESQRPLAEISMILAVI